MEIIREAAIRAIDKDCHSLNMSLLEAAYNARIAGTEIGKGKVNPFSPGKFSEETAGRLKHPPK